MASNVVSALSLPTFVEVFPTQGWAVGPKEYYKNNDHNKYLGFFLVFRVKDSSWQEDLWENPSREMLAISF